jgi:cytochrome o ubiquinol oxidase subunit 1
MTFSPELIKALFGRLTVAELPLGEPIVVGTFVGVVVLGLAVVGVITKLRAWGYLWTEWFTSVDHKRIGVM